MRFYVISMKKILVVKLKILSRIRHPLSSCFLTSCYIQGWKQEGDILWWYSCACHGHDWKVRSTFRLHARTNSRRNVFGDVWSCCCSRNIKSPGKSAPQPIRIRSFEIYLLCPTSSISMSTCFCLWSCKLPSLSFIHLYFNNINIIHHRWLMTWWLHVFSVRRFDVFT